MCACCAVCTPPGVCCSSAWQRAPIRTAVRTSRVTGVAAVSRHIWARVCVCVEPSGVRGGCGSVGGSSKVALAMHRGIVRAVGVGGSRAAGGVGLIGGKGQALLLGGSPDGDAQFVCQLRERDLDSPDHAAHHLRARCGCEWDCLPRRLLPHPARRSLPGVSCGRPAQLRAKRTQRVTKKADRTVSGQKA